MERHTLLESFFKNALQDIYYAEQQLVKALHKMEAEATTDELKSAFREHRVETEGHVDRLEQVFESIGEDAKTQKCEAIEGIIKEAGTIIDETKNDTYTRDIALIFAAQKAEHYEIASYGGLVALAQQLDLDTAADLLVQTLEEEKNADSTLTQIAENYLYEAAKAE